jgi:L,D-transpeptidase catalytic domain
VLTAIGGIVGFGSPASYTAPSTTLIKTTGLSADVSVAVPAAPGNSRSALVQNALSALSDDVARKSHKDALRLAFKAYYSFKAAHPEEIRKPYLYFVDYGLDNRTPRGYVFDMEQLTVVDGPFIVAHGRGSSVGKDGVPMRFSNTHGAATTSLGLYVTGESYDFSGHAGGLYHSIGLRLNGESGKFNSAARARGVVVHGAPYVTASGSGRSEGCPAMEQSRARRLIPQIANGSVVFLFSPNDGRWLSQDPWVNAGE